MLRKCGHLVGYGLLCLCWLLLLRGGLLAAPRIPAQPQGQHQSSAACGGAPDWAWLAVLGTFLVAAADELHQMSIPSRSGSWWDVPLDTSAAVVVVLLVRAKALRDSRDQATMATRR